MATAPPEAPSAAMDDDQLVALVTDPDAEADAALEAAALLGERLAHSRREVAELDAKTREAAPDSLIAALARAQARFPRIEKNLTAEVRGKDGRPGSSYSYADLGEILAAVRPVLAEEGIALIQRLATNDAGKVRLITELRRGEELLDSTLDLGQTTANPQNFGGALTYLRRYSAVTLLGIAAEQDLDAQEVEPAPRNGNGAPAALPDWATPLGDDGLKRMGRELTVLVGDERARDTVRSVKASIGTIPAVLRPFVSLILEHYLDAGVAEPGEASRRFMAEMNRREAEAVAAQAEAERAKQDAAAEAPDPPAPEVSGDVPADDAGLKPQRTPAEEARDAAEAAVPPPPDTPPAGSVEPPELPSDSTVEMNMKRLREAGCICPEPLADDADKVGSGKRSDECPLKGHGIPF